jgi:hypothetical protein
MDLASPTTTKVPSITHQVQIRHHNRITQRNSDKLLQVSIMQHIALHGKTHQLRYEVQVEPACYFVPRDANQSTK